MDFTSIVKQILSEDSMAGGTGSVFGTGVASTETPFSGDNYAPGDARNVFGGAFPGVMTRAGLTGKKKYSYKKHAKKRKKKK